MPIVFSGPLPNEFKQPDGRDHPNGAEGEHVDEPHHADVDHYLVAGCGTARPGSFQILQPSVSNAVDCSRRVQLQNAWGLETVGSFVQVLKFYISPTFVKKFPKW